MRVSARMDRTRLQRRDDLSWYAVEDYIEEHGNHRPFTTVSVIVFTCYRRVLLPTFLIQDCSKKEFFGALVLRRVLWNYDARTTIVKTFC